MNVIFADQEIPTSPYKVTIEPDVDVSGVKVVGLEPSKYICRLIYALTLYYCNLRVYYHFDMSGLFS